jgi:hypothetical protein
MEAFGMVLIISGICLILYAVNDLGRRLEVLLMIVLNKIEEKKNDDLS